MVVYAVVGGGGFVFLCVFFVCYKRKLVSLDVAAGMLLMMFQSYVC